MTNAMALRPACSISSSVSRANLHSVVQMDARLIVITLNYMYFILKTIYIMAK
jgi:hypothetical protein